MWPHPIKGQSQPGEEEIEEGGGEGGSACRLNAYSYLKETKTRLTDTQS